VSLIEDAYVTQGDEGRRRIKYTGAAGAVALLLALGLVVGRDYRQRRVAGPDDVAHGLGLTVVGTMPPPAGRAQMADDDWRMVMTESVDVIRTLLLHDCHLGRARAVMVTSAMCGEGKTSLTGHLAASLARAGFRTLVIDGDLRRPAIHSLLHLAPTPGLCEVLRGEATAATAFQPSGIDRLTVLPAGRWSPAIAELLARHAWPALLAQLRREFDFILIDTAPVLPVVDTLLLGRATDGAIVAVLRGQSQLPAVYAAQQRLARVGIRTFGAVVNGVPNDTYRGRYNYAATADSTGADA
jgi:capsular exopolysaccharide synthesis family protein